MSKLSSIAVDSFELRFTGTEAFGDTALVVTTDCPDGLGKLRTAAERALGETFPGAFEEFDAHGYRPHVTV